MAAGMKILVSDSLSKQGVEVLEKAGFTVVVKTKLPKDELLKEVKDADGLIVRSGTKVTAEVIAAAEKLKVVGRAGSGLDNVDTPAATRRGIVVMNTPGGNTVTTAEHTLSMICAMARRIPQATASVKSGKWEKDKFMGLELYNKVLGIVGVGQIGGYLSKLAQGIGMSVVAYDPYLAQERAEKMGVTMVELDELFRRADIISVHTPLTPETKGLINAAAIAKMKPGVLIVNCARGGIVNETDLVDALKTKRVAAAAFDVFDEEPVKADHPLLTLDNFICTPHIGAQTTEAQENVAVGIAEQVVEYFTKGVAKGAVNIPSVPPDLLPRLQPYLTLAEKLGSLQTQLCEGGIERVTVEYSGEVAGLTVAPLTIAVLKGLLTPIMEYAINYVNAPIVAKERGIEVKEVKSSDAGDFTSLIRVRVEAGKAAHQVAGTLYNKKDARVIEIDQFKVEVVPEGHMLLIHNIDRPGVIGMVGKVLGDHNINIVRMQCALEKRGGNALLIIGSDTDFPSTVLGQIKSSSNILSVKVANLS
ncbi:D-3-phosphoglycerate dehydrogenase [Nitrospira moscoviensis]|uniref:D-3-phosphoglycerate dehydrogenase n=2 Tax=Nitrospira moscoviensis TaxID=42253 RepID=A0A0K2GHQ9_NITMO|nr:D-3-phosphoglycerate dehydrogenase [Nitrospira moscoviensis]